MTPSTLSNTLFKVLASLWPVVSGDNFNMDSDLHFETHFNLNNDVHAHNLEARFPTYRLGGHIDH